jgi:hypothetical protein
VGKRSGRGPGPGDMELVLLVLGPPEPTAASDMRGLDKVVGALLWFFGGEGGKQGAVVAFTCVCVCVCVCVLNDSDSRGRRHENLCAVVGYVVTFRASE